MERIPRTATAAITALTALCWIVAFLFGAIERSAYLLGFIPARFSGLISLSHAVPTPLTPLSATLAHANAIHIGFNMLIFVWCGSQVERVIGDFFFLQQVGQERQLVVAPMVRRRGRSRNCPWSRHE